MKGKILFVTGAAIGYVLGARAGRKRYEQIVAAADKVWQTPGVQKQVHQVQDFAAEKIGDIPDALIEGAKKAVSSVVGRSNTTKATTARANTAKASAAESAAAKPTTATKPAAKKAAAKKPGATSTTRKTAASTSTAAGSSAAKSANAGDAE